MNSLSIFLSEKYACDALRKLAGEGDDEPLAMRVNQALKCLRPLRSMRNFDTTIIEMMNSCCNLNWTVKERGEAIAEIILTILVLCDESYDRQRFSGANR